MYPFSTLHGVLILLELRAEKYAPCSQDGVGYTLICAYTLTSQVAEPQQKALFQRSP